MKVDSAGTVTQWVRGTVPKTIPQTSQGGEFTAALMAAHMSVGMTTLVDDCANVVDAFSGHYDGGEKCGTNAVSHRTGLTSTAEGKLLETQTYGATIRLAKEQLRNRAQMLVVKCKAHVLDDMSEQLIEELSPEEERVAKGNDGADHHAKTALQLFDPVDPELRGSIDRATQHVRAAVHVIAKMLPLWAMSKEKKKRKHGGACKAAPDDGKDEAPAEGERVPMEELHCWVRGPTGWFCNTCRAKTGYLLPKSRARQRCPGLPDLLAANSTEPTGHVVAEFRHVAGDFSICLECGKWGTKSAKGLRKPCARIPKTRSSMTSWRRVFKQGKHPDPHKNMVFTR